MREVSATTGAGAAATGGASRAASDVIEALLETHVVGVNLDERGQDNTKHVQHSTAQYTAQLLRAQ